MGYPNQTVVFQIPRGFIMITDIIIAQKKKSKGFFFMKFDLKIVFSLTASVRDT